jgi:hypothetical protein
MSQHSPILQKIRREMCGDNFEVDAEESIHMMLDWIRDLKNTDPIAAWCYKILQGIYHMD